MMPADFASHRAFLKDTLRLQIDFRQTDQRRGVDPPPLAKPPRSDQQIIRLAAQIAKAPDRSISAGALAVRAFWRSRCLWPGYRADHLHDSQ
jgi:hypothetical protein